jgi:hypothetical protein
VSLDAIETRARKVLTANAGRRSALHLLLSDDAFCALMMGHRAGQGVQLPDQDGALPASARLAFLHALATGEGVAEAREGCDGRKGLLARLARAREMIDSQEFSGASDVPSIREMLISSLTAMLEREDPNSHWAAQYLLYGGERIWTRLRREERPRSWSCPVGPRSAPRSGRRVRIMCSSWCIREKRTGSCSP